MADQIICELQEIVRGHPELDAGAHGPELRPVLPRGPWDAAICFVGRDPGEQEAKCGVPFSGHCGQRLRSLLEEYRQSGLPRQQSGTDAERFFWLNTVLFNPKHNQAWSQEVRIARQLTLLQLMHEQWGGCELVTLGKEAFFWFGIGQPDEIRGKLRAFWHQGDMKYERNIEVPLPGLARTVCLYPLPHP